MFDTPWRHFDIKAIASIAHDNEEEREYLFNPNWFLGFMIGLGLTQIGHYGKTSLL